MLIFACIICLALINASIATTPTETDPCEFGNTVPKCALGEAKSTLNGYYFDKSTSSCLPYQLKCGQPAFNGIEDCINKCEPKNGNDLPLKCYLGLGQFSCPRGGKSITYYKYNPFLDKCESLISKCIFSPFYVFLSMEECKSNCQPKDCSKQRSKPTCGYAEQGSVPKTFYTYDNVLEKCVSSVQPGECNLPPQNKFETEEECKDTCEKPEPSLTTKDCSVLMLTQPQCEQQRASATLYTYDKAMQQCKEFHTYCFHMLSTGKNVFKTLQDCQAKCVPKVCSDQRGRFTCGRVPPDAVKKNYYTYDNVLEQCVKSSQPVDCGVPATNLFFTEENCEAACEKPEPPLKSKDCTASLGNYTCDTQRVAATWYTYDQTQQICKEFQTYCYRMLSTGKNVFKTLDDCQEVCEEIKPKECTEVTKTFTCATKKAQPMVTYYKYRPATEVCESFQSICKAYGDEPNVFSTEEECKTTCVKTYTTTTAKPKECSQLTATITCKTKGQQQQLTFYKFEPDSGKCEMFQSPCQAYAKLRNVFTSEEECKTTCGKAAQEPEKECSELTISMKCKTRGEQLLLTFYKFEPESGDCEMFQSPCKAYSKLTNVFTSENECKKTCVKNGEDDADLCSRGPSYPRPTCSPWDAVWASKGFYFDPTIAQCKEHVFECTMPDFTTMEACQEKCEKKADDLCERGPSYPRPTCPPELSLFFSVGFYFNPKTSICEPRVFECSAPDFKTVDECLNTCPAKKTGSNKPLDCYRPLDDSFKCPINVRYLPIPHVKYNAFKDECETFNASCPLPLDGNNLFKSLDECKMVCQPKDCSVKFERPKCRDVEVPVRTFYTFQKKACRKFETTCSSVSTSDLNVFATEEDCEDRCVKKEEEQDCNFKVEPLECGLKDNSKTFTRYTSKGSSCVQFETNCLTKKAGKNIFATLKECQKTCETKVDCSPDVVVRRCPGGNGIVKKTYDTYRRNAKKCENFETFCENVPKKNVFATLADCQKGCEPKQCTELLSQNLACMTRSPQLELNFYTFTKGKCEKFQSLCNYAIFNNVFATEEECKKTCAKNDPDDDDDDVCELPKVAGPCKGSFPRFYYDLLKDDCVKFIYGGCQGNGNNFKTLKECRNKCMKGNDDESSGNSSNNSSEKKSGEKSSKNSSATKEKKSSSSSGSGSFEKSHRGSSSGTGKGEPV